MLTKRNFSKYFRFFVFVCFMLLRLRFNGHHNISIFLHSSNGICYTFLWRCEHVNYLSSIDLLEWNIKLKKQNVYFTWNISIADFFILKICYLKIWHKVRYYYRRNQSNKISIMQPKKLKEIAKVINHFLMGVQHVHIQQSISLNIAWSHIFNNFFEYTNIWNTNVDRRLILITSFENVFAIALCCCASLQHDIRNSNSIHKQKQPFAVDSCPFGLHYKMQ